MNKNTETNNKLKSSVKQGLINSINPCFLKKEFITSESKKQNKIMFGATMGGFTLLHATQTFLNFPIKLFDFSKMNFKAHLILFLASYTAYFVLKELIDIEKNVANKNNNKNDDVEFLTNKNIKFKESYQLDSYININYDELKNMEVPCLYGVDDKGSIVLKDMVQFPHLLLMGKTGNGKSSFLNCMLQSSMYFSNNVLYIMTDFKDLELCQYEHFDNTIYINKLEVFQKLFNNISKFVKKRTRTFKKINTKNIEQYNSMVEESEKEPYIVFVIDECAELKIHKDKKLLNDINDTLIEAVNKFRALGIIFVLCLQRASGDQLDTNTRSQLPEKICFNVDKRDSEFVDISRDEVKNLQIGELRNKDKNGIRKTIKSLFIQDNPMKTNFSNSVYEKLHLKNTGKEYKYFNMLPENANAKNIFKKEINKNFCNKNTSAKVLEIKKYLTENIEEFEQNKNGNYEEDFKLNLVKKQLENKDTHFEGCPNQTSKINKNDLNSLNIFQDNYNEDIQKFISFCKNYADKSGKLPDETTCLLKMEITPKKFRLLKEKTYKLGFLKKENQEQKRSKYIVNFDKINQINEVTL